MCVILLNIEREKKNTILLLTDPGVNNQFNRITNHFFIKNDKSHMISCCYLIFRNELFTNENAKNLLYSPFSQLMVLFNPLANQIPQLQKK